MFYRSALFSFIAPVVAMALIGLPGSDPAPAYPCQVSNGEVIVTTCGDTSGWHDSPAIQRANDTIAAEGGGRVVFPPGAYTAGAIRQDSNVEFYGPEGAAATSISRGADDTYLPVIHSRQRETYGTITKGSNILSVTTTTGIQPGVLVGVRGAGGPSESQRATLAVPVTSGQTSIAIKDYAGLPSAGPNYLVVDNEIISYEKITMTFGAVLTGVKRGQLGTSAASHSANTYAWQAQRFVAEVVSISGTTVTLDAPAPRSVTGALTTIGTVGVRIRGLTLVGHQSDKANSAVVLYYLAKNARITDSVIRNGDQIGVRLLHGSRDAIIENNVFQRNGNNLMSAGVWLYGGAIRNTVRNNVFEEDFAGVAIDDRTQLSSEWDAGSNDNVVEGNTIRVGRVANKWYPNTGVFIAGSRDNSIVGNTITGPAPGDMSVIGPWYGVYISKNNTQGQVAVDSLNNSITNNTVRRTEWGLYVTGSLNDFVGNHVEGATEPVRDAGLSNYFDGNVCTDASGQTMDCGLSSP
jgi:polygalacturonase